MGESLIAFSLAANVVQFIDFGSRVATNFRTFYKPASSQADEAPDVEAINTDLQGILKELQEPLLGSKSNNNGLVFLVQQCQKAAAELDKILMPMAKARTQNLGKREALKASFKAIWKEEDIKSLSQRLDTLRNQLTLHLLTSLRCVAVFS